MSIVQPGSSIGLGSGTQYLRQCSLIVGDDSGNGLDLSEMRVRFQVRQQIIGTPGYADITVTNLSKATANLIQKEFTKVRLSVGYQGTGLGLLFEGDLIQKRVGRESPTDTILALLATHADKAYNFGTVSTTLSAGHTRRDQVDTVLTALNPYGVSAGYITDLGSSRASRNVVLFGMARDILRDIARATGTVWSFQGNKLQIMQKSGQETLPGNAIVLNSRTGLIGLPTQTIDGIQGRCLLNTTIKPGTRIQIDEASIQQAPFSASISDVQRQALIPGIEADGFYRVLISESFGVPGASPGTPTSSASARTPPCREAWSTKAVSSV